MTKATVPATTFEAFDHLHFWVGNAKQAAVFYMARFGLKPIAYKGLETGSRNVCTHVVGAHNIRLAFSSPLTINDAVMGAHMQRHGDGVRDVAFTVEDATAAYNAAVQNGAASVQEPQTLKDEHGEVIVASIQTYGDTIHTFVQRSNYKGAFLPGYADWTAKVEPMSNITTDTGLLVVDHIVGNQDWDQMQPVCDWYEEKLGFHRFWSVDDKQIHTDYSALRSIVMTDRDENIKMPVNEPAKGKKVSQIEEYVNFYGGAGVQHIALRTEDIIDSVSKLRERGVEFLSVPSTYYEQLRRRLSVSNIQVSEDLDIIEKLHILVDFDEKGYLLQIFTKPVEDRPTLFFEIIQRRNNEGFGVGNFRALFKAIEDEQEKRGTLVDSA
jgi:4-hydroxyphenylpyruvate dioxygenase